MKALVTTDAFAAIPIFIWFYFFKTEADHYAALPAYGYSGVWDFAVYFPLAMSLSLLISIALFNFATRQPGMIALIAGAALLPVLPYAISIGGGV